MRNSTVWIVAAILAAALLVVFLPRILETIDQNQRDASLACTTWRLSHHTLQIKRLKEGVSRAEIAANERERQKHGCSPE